MGRKRIEILNGVEATQEFAARLAPTLPANTLIALYGDLGAGKTTFLQGLVRGLGGSQDLVQSPTFVYLHIYPTSPPVYHFDLYRMLSPQDFLAMGFEEYFEKGGIIAIEWPQRIAPLLPPHPTPDHESISKIDRSRREGVALPLSRPSILESSHLSPSYKNFHDRVLAIHLSHVSDHVRKLVIT